MIKNVLISLDYSPSAEKVAEAGYALAKAMQAKITLLHVIAEPTYYSSVQYSPIMGLESFGAAGLFQAETAEEVKKAAGYFLEKTKAHLGDRDAGIIVSEGDFADTILEVAREQGADIVVMGTHSRRGLEKILMGSVAEKVLRNTSIPAYIIPTREMAQPTS